MLMYFKMELISVLDFQQHHYYSL